MYHFPSPSVLEGNFSSSFSNSLFVSASLRFGADHGIFGPQIEVSMVFSKLLD